MPESSEHSAPIERSWIAPLVMLAAVGVAGLLPFLRFRDFYLSGDSIAQWVPVSRRIGELLTAGDSHLMDPSLWRGGNFVAEARFGIWNPFALLLDVTVLQLNDLAVAAMLANVAYLLILAAGVYLLAVEYGARSWPAAAAGVVAATGGWTLWMDAGWWTPHLASSAYAPFVWVAARRVARGVGSPIWLVVAGAMCVTVGNPYSNIVIGVIVVAVAVEFADRDHLVRLVSLAGALAAIALIALFVYVPFRQTSVVGTRETGLFNNEQWASGVTDLLTMSTPTALPWVDNFNRPVLGFPGTYLAWFVIPLAPWFRWNVLARRQLAGLAVFGGIAGLLLLGPSNVWFFRWPMRLVPYAYLPIMVAVAVLLSTGLVADHARRRAAASGGLVAFGAYLAWSDVPDDLWWHLAAALVVGLATWAAVSVARRSPQVVGPLLITATLAVLVLQLAWKPENESVRHWRMPNTVATFEERFSDRYTGTVMQISRFESVPPEERNADAVFVDVMAGSANVFADIESVSVYSGIGFSTHDAALCIRFDGATCAGGWDRLFSSPDGGDAVLADLLGVDTVVVQRSLVDTLDEPAPPGWEQVEATAFAVVWERVDERPWPDARLTDVVGPIEVDRATEERAHREVVGFERTGEGDARLTFARLAWPGYTATVDGRSLPVGGGPAGLLVVTVPADVTGGEIVLSWVPPFWRPTLGLLVLGFMVAAGTQFVWWRSQRGAGGGGRAPGGKADEASDEGGAESADRAATVGSPPSGV